MQASGKKNVRGTYYGVAIEKEIAMKQGTGVAHLEVEFDLTSEEAEKAHQEMIQRRATQSTHMDSSNQGDNDPLPTDMDIVSDVLGSRSRNKKGFGSLPRLKAFGGKRTRTSASVNIIQQDHIDRIIKEHGHLKQYTTDQHEFLVQQTQDMNEMKKLFQQIQGLVPGLSVLEHLLSTVQPPPPPSVIFDDASTTQPFESVHEENDSAENLD